MHKAAALVASLIVAPASAQADWEFTRWGMTIQEVERASRYDAMLNGQGSGCLMQMRGPYTFLGIRFPLVRFCFDGEMLLEAVDLLADAKAYDAVDRALQRAYGPSRIARGGDTPESFWIDHEHGDRISLSRGTRTVVTFRVP